MEEIKSFCSTNSAQIWTLLSVVIGGIITYFSTSNLEKRKNKQQSQKENLEQVLIPFCTCLEQTTEAINIIYQDPRSLFSEQLFDEWVNSLSAPLKYLDAAKRVFLTKSMREKLHRYKSSVLSFVFTLNQECEHCLILYKHYASSKLESFPSVPAPMLITFSMQKTVDIMTKIAILNKSELTLRDQFISIDFVRNDDPENYRVTSVNLDSEIRDTWGAIMYGLMDVSDIDDESAKLSCSLLDYIDENLADEKEKLTDLIDKTNSSQILISLADELEAMTNELIKTIDKIAN